MNLTGVANLATSMSDTGTDQAVGMAVLKKALDSETQTAAALLQALPPVPSTRLPPNLGQNINTKA
ncbi:MAG: YjfB family protein [Pseudomonadota bacterium]